jgi:hypothetical protein
MQKRMGDKCLGAAFAESHLTFGPIRATFSRAQPAFLCMAGKMIQGLFQSSDFPFWMYVGGLNAHSDLWDLDEVFDN